MSSESIKQSRRRPALAGQAYVTATLVLVLSVAVVFTAVSISIARAAM
jgi:hypothetical protein